ncbi:MAG: hypothetical protein V4481_03935 [Patescibacteria group bacterium]
MFYDIIKDVITFILTLAGIIIAGMGLATWKKQIKGTKEFDTAYNLHYSILKLRNAIKYVRNPAVFPSESYKAIEYSKAKYPHKSKDEIEKDSHAYVYEMRWDEIKDADTEMESYLLAAEVLWGPEILELMKPLNKKIVELNIALKQNFQPELRTKNAVELHDVIYDKGNWITNEEDSFGKEVSSAIKGITDYIKSKIS